MTDNEQKIASALQACTFLPGCMDKKFVGQLDNWSDRAMTDKGKAFMMKLLVKYRRQIPNYDKLLNNEHGKSEMAD